MVSDYSWNLTDINAELPEELGILLNSDTSSLSTGTTAVSYTHLTLPTIYSV